MGGKRGCTFKPIQATACKNFSTGSLGWVRFATSLLRDAERLVGENLCYRASVSRSYYAMYHAMRAAVFVFHGGDDHQEHKILPAKHPPT